MVEFAINNLVHVSTQHTPFFVNGLRHPRLPTLLEFVSWLRGGDSLEQKPFWLLFITWRRQRHHV